MISNDPKIGDLDFEVVDGANSYKKGRDADNNNSKSNNAGEQPDDAPSSPTMSMDPLMGLGEGYLSDRKFYVNGFERLIKELNGPESFWWDPNGSLRKVSLSAFDERMLIQRKMGLLDLDESEAEKKKRREEEEREKARIKAMQVRDKGRAAAAPPTGRCAALARPELSLSVLLAVAVQDKALARKLKDDLVKAKAEAKKVIGTHT